MKYFGGCDVGSTYTKGEIFGTIESVKAASEIYMPVSGTVLEINEELIEKKNMAVFVNNV